MKAQVDLKDLSFYKNAFEYSFNKSPLKSSNHETGLLRSLSVVFFSIFGIHHALHHAGNIDFPYICKCVSN